MARRPEWVFVALLAGALAVAALLGRATAPNPALRDPRRSTLLAGPMGARGLADALHRLGLATAARRRPLLGVDSEPAAGLLVLLDPPRRLSAFETLTLQRYVARGGRLLVAGPRPITTCFGFAVRGTGRQTLKVDAPGSGTAWRLPRTRALLEPAPRPGACAGLQPVAADTLLRTPGGRAVAERIAFRGGGRVTVVADPAYLADRALRETDAGLVVIPWFFDGHPARVIFDEYDQGFTEGGSLLWAAARWVTSAPTGWAMLQLAAALLVLLAVGAVRFGPVAAGVERRRRSALEHVEALAEGLERGRAGDTAVALIAGGLRRRLGKAAPGGTAPAQVLRWLDTLALGAPSPAARAAVARLAALTRRGGDGARVVEAGNAVEEVWTILGSERTRARF